MGAARTDFCLMNVRRLARKPPYELERNSKPRARRSLASHFMARARSRASASAGAGSLPNPFPSDVMVLEAIAGLKERAGSRQSAIAQYVHDHRRCKETDLAPHNFRKTMGIRLRSMAQEGKVAKVKNGSFKVPDHLKRLVLEKGSAFKLSQELEKLSKAAKGPSAPKAAVKVVRKGKVVAPASKVAKRFWAGRRLRHL